MKILFFVSSLNAGGAERVACTLANAWARRGDHVTLVATFAGTQDSFYHLDDGVRLVRLHERMPTGLGRYLPGVGKWLAMRRLVARIRPDVVLSFLTNVNVNVLIATLGMNYPVVVCERTNPVYSQSAGWLLKWLRRRLYGHASEVVLQTESSVQPFLAMVPAVQSVSVVPNPLPPELPDVSLPAKSRTTIAAMGRLVPAKQFDALITAFALLAQDYPQWDLIIWGDGPLRASLEAQAAGLGLESRVQLAGRTARPWEALAQAQIFAMTSRVEGFPNVLLEAMALGLPCVVLDCPSGPAEITQNGHDAVLVPLDEPDVLVSGLQSLMDDASRRRALGTRAAESVRRRYALPAVLAQWDDVFAQAGRQSAEKDTVS